MRTKIIIAAAMLLSSVIFCAIDITKFKFDNNIILETDLDGDGKNELISQLSKPNDLQKIFVGNENGYQQILANKGAEVDSEIISTGFEYYSLTNGKRRMLIAVSGLLNNKYGGFFPSGNIILIYTFENSKLYLIKKYFSQYMPEHTLNAHVTKINESDTVTLGRYPFISAKVNNNQTYLLIQGQSGWFLINNNGDIESKVLSVPDYSILKAFRLNNNREIEAFIDNPQEKKSFMLWSSKKGKVVEFKNVNFGEVDDLKIDDNNDLLYVIHNDNIKRVKSTYSFDKQSGNVTNNKDEFIENINSNDENTKKVRDRWMKKRESKKKKIFIKTNE